MESDDTRRTTRWGVELANESGTTRGEVERACDIAGAQEPWLGAGAAPLVSFESSTWRWPPALSVGDQFGGSAEVRVLGSQGGRVERTHEVTRTETAAVDGVEFAVAVVEYRTRGPGGTTRGQFVVSPEIGLVSAREGPAAQPMLALQLEHVVHP